MSEFDPRMQASPESELEESLTPRAKEMLSLLLEDLRRDVLESASRRSWGIEIGARDVIEAFEERTRKRFFDSDERRTRFARMITVSYGIFGMILAVAGGVLFALEGGSFDGPSEFDQVTIALAATGFSAGVAAFALWVFRRRAEARNLELVDLEMERREGWETFLERWIRIESALRLLAASDLGESSAELPLRAVLESVVRVGRVDAETRASLLDLLAVRNQVVHGEGVDDSDLRASAQEAARLAYRFEREARQVTGDLHLW